MEVNKLMFLNNWWKNITLQSRLLLIATLIVSMIMSSITFWTVNSIQAETSRNDTRFARDLGLLFAANITPLVFERQNSQTAQLTERFYNSTTSLRYIILLDKEGEIYYCIPFFAHEVQSSMLLKEYNIFTNLNHNFALADNSYSTEYTEILDILIPLKYLDKHLGFVILGINPNPTLISFSKLAKEVTIAVFLSIWVILMLGAAFNALTITQPIKELLVGVKNITAGNFGQRIDLPFGGELGELINSFNKMAKCLENYEEQNIVELTSEKAKLDTLVSTIADGAILLDPNLDIILMNPVAKNIFNWEGQKAIGENIERLLPLNIKASLKVILTNMLILKNGNENILYQKEFSIFDEQRTVRILLTRVFDQSRIMVKGIVLTIRDITKEVELDHAKSQFISNVSHELRTPLFNIKSFIETLEDYDKNLTDEQKQEFLHIINRETNRLTRLVNDVLDLSKLESTNNYKSSKVSIKAIINEIFSSYQISAQYKHIYLTSEVEPHLPTVKIDHDLIIQVIGNLVNNAIKFTYSGGHIVVRSFMIRSTLHSKNLKVRIEISDDGIGIEHKHHLAIFDRFSRIENFSYTFQGTGLGLSIVENILWKYNTRMSLESQIGVGSTFWFDLQL
uniref:Uncharacterized sensor-like histidine kinase ycf26 n=1 Tax=Gronococcus sybilensis TaxID=3028029 RepID=A0A9Y1I2N1_9RHOD|nr:hypothetical protein GRSY_147 [Gronococcus sybilensis]